MNETIKNLMERRSIRKFKSEQIKNEELNEILEAGKYAPTGGGRQSPVMVVVQNPALVQKLSKMNAAVMGSSSDPFYGAPTIVAVFSDKNRNTYLEDGALVIGNMLNAAHSLDVDSIWIHRAKEVFLTDEGKALMREWGLSDDYVGIGHCALGYRDCEYPEPAPRKDDYVRFAK